MSNRVIGIGNVATGPSGMGEYFTPNASLSGCGCGGALGANEEVDAALYEAGGRMVGILLVAGVGLVAVMAAGWYVFGRD